MAFVRQRDYSEWNERNEIEAIISMSNLAQR